MNITSRSTTRVFVSIVLSILFSAAATYVLRLALNSGLAPAEVDPASLDLPTDASAADAQNLSARSPARKPAGSQNNPTAVFVFVPVLVGNSGNHFGPDLVPGRGRRRWGRK